MSKSFWGGLRIGWVRAPRGLAAERAAVDLGTPIVEQLAAAHLLADAEPTLTARRDLLRRQRAGLMEQLRRHLPEWHYQAPEGGLSLWATLPAPVGSALAATAERFGVRAAAGSRFAVEGFFERHLRVPFTLPEMVVCDHLHLDGPLTPREIALRARLSTGVVTALIDRLEACGFVRRNPHPGDRRSVLMHYLPQERTVVVCLYGVLGRFGTEVAGMDDSARAALHAFLAGMTDALMTAALGLGEGR